MRSDPDAIRTICSDADARLWEAFARSAQMKPRSPDVSRLTFPTKRSGQLRVSEQEARFAFAEAVQASGRYYYSVETPTREEYGFSGKGRRSAATDLTLYDLDATPVLNVEFKAQGTSSAAQDQSKLAKDVEKLVREPPSGMWFHLLESVDTGTIPKLLGVLADAFSEQMQAMPFTLKAKPMALHVCVLKHGFSIHKSLDMVGSSDSSGNELHARLRFSYQASRTALLDVIDDNGWHLHRRPMPQIN